MQVKLGALNFSVKLTINLVLNSALLLMATTAQAQPQLPVPKPPAIRSPQAVPPPPINISVPQFQAQDEPAEPAEPAEPDEEEEPSEPEEPAEPSEDEGGTDAIAPKPRIRSIRRA